MRRQVKALTRVIGVKRKKLKPTNERTNKRTKELKNEPTNKRKDEQTTE